MMKVLIVRMWADVLNINNYNCQEIGLAKALIRKGHICDLVLYTDKESYEDDFYFDDKKNKIHIYYLSGKNILKNCIFEDKLYDIVKKYDIVQTAEYDQIMNLKLHKKCNNKMVVYHGPYYSEFTKGYKIKSFISDFIYMFNNKYKNVHVISKSLLATNFLKNKGFNNVVTVGVGIDTERFTKEVVVNNECVQSLLTIKKNENLKYLLYIGKLEERRNISFLIELFKEVNDRINNTKLILVGKGEKEYIDKCFDLIERFGLKDNIVYIESLKQEELPLLYKNSEIFLLPTQYEIFGMVLLEAMYFGTIPFTTMNGGSSTLIQNGKNGFICGLDNKDDWIRLIVKILENSKDEIDISLNAKKTIRDNYTWDKLVDQFINIYIKGVDE